MRYLFPFENIKKGSRVIIYGAGEMGQCYLRQIEMTKYCQIICLLDKNYQRYQALHIAVSSPDRIVDYEDEYDYIIIARASRTVAESMREYLENVCNVPRKKIIYIGVKQFEFNVISDNDQFVSRVDLAFNINKCIPIAIGMGGGFGDCILYKRFVEAILQWDENIFVDLYVPHNRKEFVKGLYMKDQRINHVVGTMAQYGIEKKGYAASLRMEGPMVVDVINQEKMKNHQVLLNKFLILEKECDEYGYLPGKMMSVHYARCEKDNLKCYDAYNRYSAFDVHGYKTNIPMDRAYEDAYLTMGLEKYIVVNYGFDRRDDEIDVQAKVWPLEYYEQFVYQFRKKYPNIKVVQIGIAETKKIEGCHQYVLGQSLELVKYVLKNALVHLDCEGGMVHLATQLGTKCIVLFGPTPVKYYGYPCNINIVSTVCSNCYWLVDDFSLCYKKMKKPECMYSILPELVMKKIEAYMNTISPT